MRIACVLLIAAALGSTGCTAFLIGSGVEPSALRTREEVRAALGTPVASGDTECEPFDEFRTRRKLAEHWKGMGLAMGWVMTGGFGEFVFFPHQLAITTRRTMMGQHLVFTYDADGNVTSARWDGKWVFGRYPKHRTEPTEPAPEVPSGNGDPDFRKRGTERFQVRLVDRDGERP